MLLEIYPLLLTHTCTLYMYMWDRYLILSDKRLYMQCMYMYTYINITSINVIRTLRSSNETQLRSIELV